MSRRSPGRRRLKRHALPCPECGRALVPGSLNDVTPEAYRALEAALEDDQLMIDCDVWVCAGCHAFRAFTPWSTGRAG